MWSNLKFHLQVVKIYISTITLGKCLEISIKAEYTHTQQFHLIIQLTESCTYVFLKDMYKNVHNSIFPD